MDSITFWDFGFGVVTTVALGVLAVVEFLAERKRRRFEDTQIALDIQAALTTSEIIGLLRKDTLSDSEREFLQYVHAVALDRQTAMDNFSKLKPKIREAVTASLARVYAVVQSDPLVRDRQEAADAAYGTNVVDRSKFTWGASAEKLGKWDVLALAGARWLREHPEIRTRRQFEDEFGRIVRPVVAPHAGGASFDPKLLLEPVVFDGQRETYAKRGHKWLDAHGEDGVIQFDDQALRVGWDLGFSRKGGGAAHLALVEHFRSAFGYDIRPVR
ncbi:hypothetical protein [Microbacterium sp. NPDC096154]|uniref:hypothetical protein n=1 Tax=Microbacterium sp. NPDC096154 TaxID=3155549 RepID=UPI003327F1F2